MNLSKIFAYDPFSWKVKISAGIIIILDSKEVLLCHPSGAKWSKTYSFPKGHIEGDESLIDAAIRETKEETSLIINKEMISNQDTPILVEYKRKNTTYKKVFLFLVHINKISEIGIENKILPQSSLQLEEVDWCGFLSKEDAKVKIFSKFQSVLDDVL